MNTALNQQITEIYRKRAEHYDFTANLYYLLGYREWAYRRQAVAALHLNPGDTVVEIACGTGLNFPLYQEVIGPQGTIIGVDITDAMLAQAQQRMYENDWQNVTLVQADAQDYAFPIGVNAIISTYALSLIPNCAQIITTGAQALAPNGRLSLLELKIPASWPEWLVKIGFWLTQPFAPTTEEWRQRRPWSVIQQTMQERLTNVSTTEMYLGSTYVIAGQKA